MAKSFTADVDAFVRKTDARLLAVFRSSAQDVIAEMQEPGPSVANPSSFGTGHMPIDTGFLRASLQAGIDEPVARSSTPAAGHQDVAYNPAPVALVIAGARLGQTIFATYGAVYARAMEARYGFVRLAAQNWQKIVGKNVRIAKERVRPN